MNIVILSGNLGDDVILVDVNESCAVAKFSIAENIFYKDKDGNDVTSTKWHRIQAWNGIAKICAEKLKKGMKIIVHGNLSYNEYTNREDKLVKEPVINIERFEINYPKSSHVKNNFSVSDIPF